MRIAETAMWMMDHIMNNRLSLEYVLGSVEIAAKSGHTRTDGTQNSMEMRAYQKAPL